MKVPDSGQIDGYASIHRHMDIGRTNPYEQARQQAGMRIRAADAGVQSTKHLTFIHDGKRSGQRPSKTNV